jgi:CBS domain-containing protein
VGAIVPVEAKIMSVVTTTRFEIDLELGTVAEAMTRSVVTVQPAMTASEALGLMRRKGIGGAPVVHEGRVVGIVTVSDLAGPHPYPMQTGPFLRPHNGASGWCVGDLMTESPITAEAGEPLADAVIRMAQTRVDRLPVVDERGRPIGIVAREDIVRVLAKAIRSSPSWVPSRSYLPPD